MNLEPANISELSDRLAEAHAKGAKVTEVDLGALNRVKAFTPEDMTVTTEAGISVAKLQKHLNSGGQWVPIDPPNARSISVGTMLSNNLSGPHRFGYGTVRDHLIGLTAVLADGRVVKNGGQVVKNVAGYDLCKLFVGNRGTLGVIVEATFKLLPLPEQEVFLSCRSASLTEAMTAIEQIKDSRTSPVVLDLDNLAGKRESPVFTVTLGYAGTVAETDWQASEAKKLGFESANKPKEQAKFWASAPHTLSVAPAYLLDAFKDIDHHPFMARAGNGVIYYHGDPPPAAPDLPYELMQRIKDRFDPKQILPQMPW